MRNSTRDELINHLDHRIERLEEDLRSHLRQFHEIEDQFAECEICRCVVFKNENTKGKGEVRSVEVRFGCVTEDYIYYPYYCKKHKPKPAVNQPPTGNTGGVR